MPLGSFDVVTEMDWLSKNNVEIVCKKKLVDLTLPSGVFIKVKPATLLWELSVLLCMNTQKCLKMGHLAFLAMITY